MSGNKYINKQEFIENNAKRIPVCVVVDCSGSMKEYDGTSKTRMDRVNDGISLFYEGVRGNIKTRRAVDIMFIQVGNGVKILRNFTSTDINAPKFESLNEKNNLTDGIKIALKKLDERKEIYKSNHIDYYQPWLVIMSDGDVNKEFTRNQAFEIVQDDVRARESNGKIVVFPICIQTEPQCDDYNVWSPYKPETYEKRNIVMANFSNNEERLIKMDPGKDKTSFEGLFQFLHRSASSVANNKGILKDSNYGNFESNKATIISGSNYAYKEEKKDESQYVDIQEKDEEKLIEEQNKRQEQDKKRIELARKELEETTTNYSYNSNTFSKRDNISFMVNGKKAFPIKKNEDNKTVLTTVLYKNDNISISNNNDLIFECLIDSDGNYQFIIEGRNVDMSRTKNKTFENDEKKADDLNEEINNIISSIPDWDKI